jgi:hypothetical protein
MILLDKFDNKKYPIRSHWSKGIGLFGLSSKISYKKYFMLEKPTKISRSCITK